MHIWKEYETIRFVLEKINYKEHKWLLCVDLKMVNFLLGQQGGYTNHLCFLCLWDSRDKEHHWLKKDWPVRENMLVGKSNVINKPLVSRERIILPPLHIKLGFIKQFIKALQRDGSFFCIPGQHYEWYKYRKTESRCIWWSSNPKTDEWPGFRKYHECDRTKSVDCICPSFEKPSWKSQGTNLSNLITNFRNLGCHMSIKVHYLDSHLDRFPENLGDFSEERGKRFHQDIKIIEKRYQGRWNANMMADYCWNLQRDNVSTSHSRKSEKENFRIDNE